MIFAGIVASRFTGVATAASLEETFQLALADAAHRTSASVQIVSREAITWRDGSLGCPQPGIRYTQALVPGYRIRLRTPSGEVLDYHANRRGRIVLCPASRATEPLADPRS